VPKPIRMQQGRTPVRYPVAFRTGPGAPLSGTLNLDRTSLVLRGRSGEEIIELSVPYSAVDEVRIGRSKQEAMNGRPTVMLACRDASPVQIEPLGTGLLHELTDLLAALATEHADVGEQVVVTVPLRKDCVARAKELVAQGPPFDPAVLGLRRHEVFVTERAAVFVFTGPHIRARLNHATRNPILWLAGLAWSACVAGRPRLSYDALPAQDAEPVYRWAAAGEPA